MKLIAVSCAIVYQQGRILAAQRSAQMEHAGLWEFPGGKIEAGESPEACLIREIQEELGIAITIAHSLSPVTYAYPTKTVCLYPFWVDTFMGILSAHEHAHLRWCSDIELQSLEWVAADIPIMQAALVHLAQFNTP